MNKQEAIKRVEQMGEFERFVDEPVSKKSVLDIISLIDEHQKVVVPKFVAEWIEDCKNESCPLRGAMKSKNVPLDVNDWLLKPGQEIFTFPNQETFASAWLDGYEVKTEKLYTVEIPNPNSGCTYVFLTKRVPGVSIDMTDNDCWKTDKRNQLTEAEIKQDFDFLWQFAKEVEDN